MLKLGFLQQSQSLRDITYRRDHIQTHFMLKVYLPLVVLLYSYLQPQVVWNSSHISSTSVRILCKELQSFQQQVNVRRGSNSFPATKVIRCRSYFPSLIEAHFQYSYRATHQSLFHRRLACIWLLSTLALIQDLVFR